MTRHYKTPIEWIEDMQPLIDHIESYARDTRGRETARSIADRAGVPHTVVDAVWRGTAEKMRIDYVDRLLTATGWSLNACYPLTPEEMETA